MSVLCAVCKEREATQRHHICYDPEILIDVCVLCHMKIHSHGVGIKRGQLKITPQIEEEPIPEMPIFTKMIEKDGTKYIVDKEDDEVLIMPTCINGCKLGWQLFMHPINGRFYLRCPSCGWDLEVKRIG